MEESKKFPPKWSYVENTWSEISWTVFSFNIMNGDVTVKTKEGGMIVRIPYTTIKKVTLTSKSDESTRNVTKQWDKSVSSEPQKPISSIKK